MILSVSKHLFSFPQTVCVNIISSYLSRLPCKHLLFMRGRQKFRISVGMPTNRMVAFPPIVYKYKCKKLSPCSWTEMIFYKAIVSCLPLSSSTAKSVLHILLPLPHQLLISLLDQPRSIIVLPLSSE